MKRSSTVRHVGVMERLLLLRQLVAFREMTDAELTIIANNVEEVDFEPGEVIVRQGNRTDRITVVVEGVVQVLVDGVLAPQFAEMRIDLGSLNMLARYNARFQIEARSHLRTLVIEYERLMEVMEDNFVVFSKVLSGLAREAIDIYCSLDIDFRAPERARETPAWLAVGDRQLDIVERILALRQVPTFARSSLAAVALYANRLEEVRFPAGTKLWAESEPCNHYLHVLDGVVRGQIGEKTTSLLFSSPSMPGFFSAITETGDRWYTATADTDVVALKADRNALPDVLEDNFEMAGLFLTLIARRLVRFLTQRVQLRASHKQP